MTISLKLTVLFLAASILAGCSSPENNSTTNSPNEEQESMDIESQCVTLRNDWQAKAMSDFGQAETLREEYKNKGCFEKCGRLVEDTDTTEKETWCN